MNYVKSLISNTSIASRRAKTDHKKIIRQKINEIKTNSIFHKEWEKTKTGIRYNDDIIFTNKFLTEEFKNNSNLEVKRVLEDFKRNKKVTGLDLEGISIADNFRPLDSVIYNFSLIKYNVTNGYFNKAMKNINKSIEILKENNYSYYDPLMIALRLEKNHIEAYNVENYSNLYNSFIEEISNGYLVEDPSIIITGYLYLMKFYNNFNFYARSNTVLDMTYETNKKFKIQNTFVKDSLIHNYMMCMYRGRNKKSFIAMHSNPAKIQLLYELRSLIEIYSLDPLKFYKLLDKLNQTIDYFELNEPNDPLIWQFYIKKWVVMHRLGREATACHYYEKSKNYINENINLTDSYLSTDFYKDAIFECVTYQELNLAYEIFKKNVKISPKMNCLNLIYKSFNTQFAAMVKAYPIEVQEKLEDFVKSHDKYFGNQENEMKKLVYNNLAGLGYQAIVELFERKEKAVDNKKKKEISSSSNFR